MIYQQQHPPRFMISTYFLRPLMLSHTHLTMGEERDNEWNHFRSRLLLQFLAPCFDSFISYSVWNVYVNFKVYCTTTLCLNWCQKRK